MQRRFRKKAMLSSFIRKAEESQSITMIPHKGSLCRVEDDSNIPTYIIEIVLPMTEEEEDGGGGDFFLGEHTHQQSRSTHELLFSRFDYEFASRLFAILDTESIGLVNRYKVQEFVFHRCPVFSKRDEDLTNAYQGKSSSSSSQTFTEIWDSVIACSQSNNTDLVYEEEINYIGVEGWMVFCRFIALAQYLEAKRRFSARHLQQTMRHRNAPRGSEVVVVDVPPPEPPLPLTPHQLALYEQKAQKPLPSPELDLDHSLLAAHDSSRRKNKDEHTGSVRINLFGGSQSSSSTKNLEFAVSYSKGTLLESQDEIVVRRSMADLKWLDDTFTAHKVLGGTLCGRILPPFPSAGGGVLSSHFPSDDSTLSIASTTGGAINAAAAGVGRIRDAAKSWISPIGSYLSTSASATTSATTRSDETASVYSSATGAHHNSSQHRKPAKRNLHLALPESYYNPNLPAGKARHVERYLNYLLEHPSLSSSFPLHTILTASQSGLDAARQTLEDCNRVAKELRDQTPKIDDGKGSGSLLSTSPNFTWVRTAAQAAMALKVHGMLETTGLQSASARLQHASLPNLQPSARRAAWDDTDGLSGHQDLSAPGYSAGDTGVMGGSNFEDGVVNDDGYDLLPLPVPAPERRILTLGNGPFPVNDNSGEERFHYGRGDLGNIFPMEEEEEKGAFLGDIAVDENIDKLREVIGSVDNTLSRCLASIGSIGKAHREKNNIHLAIVRGLDSWPEMRGKFVSQRSLMKGVASIDQSKEVFDESDLALIDDLSWQTSLASSAVSAAEDVRAAVRVSRTASNARAAASAAVMSAQAACEKGDFATLDEARAAQTRASIAQSHAIHAAVVEHEAKTVKRRSTLALANDVKTWNVHRKREMLKSCISFAKSQHEATRRAVDAWTCLRDGFIGTTLNPSVVERRVPVYTSPEPTAQRRPLVEPGEMTATIYESNSSSSENLDGSPTIVAVDHNILTNASTPQVPDYNIPNTAATSPQINDHNIFANATSSLFIDQKTTGEVDVEDDPSVDEKSDDIEKSFTEPEMILPFAEAAPIPEETVEDLAGSQMQMDRKRESIFREPAVESSMTEEKLSASMQSLVDGLMNWGGGFESGEEHFALPIGMATSIVFEENNVLGKN